MELATLPPRYISGLPLRISSPRDGCFRQVVSNLVKKGALTKTGTLKHTRYYLNV